MDFAFCVNNFEMRHPHCVSSITKKT